MFARVSATISTERRVGVGAVVCCRAETKEYRHGLSTMVRRDAQGVRLVLHALGRSSSASILAKAMSSFVRSSIQMSSERPRGWLLWPYRPPIGVCRPPGTPWTSRNTSPRRCLRGGKARRCSPHRAALPARCGSSLPPNNAGGSDAECPSALVLPALCPARISVSSSLLAATMNQKSSLREVHQFVSGVLTGNSSDAQFWSEAEETGAGNRASGDCLLMARL